MKIKISLLRYCLGNFLKIDTSSMSISQLKFELKKALQVQIQFDLKRLPFLYRFKNNVVDLCTEYLVQTAKKNGKFIKIDKEKRNFGDVFVRWMFNSIAYNTFDFNFFLPTNESFIDLTDMDFYMTKLGLKKCIPFPIEIYREILQKAKESVYTGFKFTIDVPTCTGIQEKRLKSLYVNETDFKQNVDKILNRYHFMGGLNNSLSTPPAVMNCVKMLDPPMKSHELFGTPLNTCSPTFCSPFPDEKLVFNSSGSFFDFREYKDDTIYFANPPFDVKICDKMTDRLLEELDKKEFSLIIIIPVWDTEQQKKHAKKYKTIDYGEVFEAYRRLVSSRFFKSDTILYKENYPFYNYFTNRLAPSSTTHFINLGKKVNVEYILSVWNDKKQQNMSGEIVSEMSDELISRTRK